MTLRALAMPLALCQRSFRALFFVEARHEYGAAAFIPEARRACRLCFTAAQVTREAAMLRGSAKICADRVATRSCAVKRAR